MALGDLFTDGNVRNPYARPRGLGDLFTDGSVRNPYARPRGLGAVETTVSYSDDTSPKYTRGADGKIVITDELVTSSVAVDNSTAGAVALGAGLLGVLALAVSKRRRR